jgi:hypothetical protein
MQTTPLAPIGATSIALPLTFAELLDLDEPVREVAATLRSAFEEPNERDWACYPCRLGEARDFAETWRARGHRVIVEPIRDHRRRVWVKDAPEPIELAIEAVGDDL